MYNFNVDLSTNNFTIMVDTASSYGFFESIEWGDELAGGLWFVPEGETMELIDYDGVYELPSEVREALRTMYIVSASFD